MAAAAVIGLDMEAMRKIVSRRIGPFPAAPVPPAAFMPSASTCTSPRRLISVTSPGTPRSTWPAMTSRMRSSRAFDSPPCASAAHLFTECSLRS